MKQQEIIEKIRKLLALAQDSSSHESEVALAMANSLLLKYNISMRDVHGNVFSSDGQKKSDIYEAVVTLPNGVDALEFWLTGLLTNHFCVAIIYNGDPLKPANSGPCKITVFGEQHNIVISLHTYNFLKQKFQALWIKHQSETKCADSDYEAYIAGLYSGLDTKLYNQKNKEFSRSLALASLKSEVEQHAAKYITHSVSVGLTPKDTAKYKREVVNKGKIAGSNIEIITAVGSTTKKPNAA